jgi:GR25 family glycosyltransferase involved in LPS biosynthesis
MYENLHIKIINAEHRSDRKAECLLELKKIGLTPPNDIFFKAKYINNLGARGCALSHAMVLSEYLFNNDLPFALVLEDDFQFISPHELNNTINNAIKYSNIWDVFLLGHNQAVPIEKISTDNILRVINSQTTSGYIVNRTCAPKIIEVFFRSAELLKNYSNLPSPNKEIARHHVSADIIWKELQLVYTFAATFPSIINQRISYSDIENKIVDYGV